MGVHQLIERHAAVLGHAGFERLGGLGAHGLGDLRLDRVVIAGLDLFVSAVPGLLHAVADGGLIVAGDFRVDLRLNRVGFQIFVDLLLDERFHVVGSHLSVDVLSDLRLHVVAVHLSVHGGAERRVVGVAHGGFNLGAHGDVDLIAYLRLDGLGHLFGYLLAGGGVDLLDDLGLDGFVDLGGQLLVGLLDDVILEVVQHFGLQAVDFGSVVVDGERIERDAQLGEVAFALGQRVVGGFEHGVEHLARAVGQRGAVRVDFAQTVAEILRAVEQLLKAVVEVAGAVHELAHRVGQLAADFVKVKAEGKLVVSGLLIGDGGGSHQRVGAAEAEVGHVGADDGGGGNVVKVDVHFVADHAALERVGQSGQTVAEHQRAVADLEHAAVGHLKIGENVVLGQHHGGHQEGDGQRLGLAVDFGLAGQVGGIVDGHFEMTALAGQLGGRHFNAVEGVMESDGEGQLLGGMALIADLGAVRIPDDFVAVLRECLIA